MGKRALFAACAALTLLPLAVAAQGPVYRERWGYLHLELLRDRVFQELSGRDAATREEVGRLLAAVDGGVPFRPVAAALAHLRQVELDASFLYRAMLSSYVLPEVVDPEADSAVCRALNVTLFQPFTTVQPGQVEFDVAVRDTSGALQFEKTLTDDTSMDDLRRARPVVAVPALGLADGEYRLQVVTRIDGAAPRQGDRRLEHTFHVLRGFQQRSEAAMNATRATYAGLDAMSQALLLGIGAEVSRAYQGEAFDLRSDAVVDLLRLEAALANVRNERHILNGLDGDLPVTVPAGDSAIACVLRFARGCRPGAELAPRPLLVFADGAPAYGPAAYRPAAPGVRGPRWLAGAMPAIGVEADCHVAFLASPGNGRNYLHALPDAIESLRQLFGVGGRPVVLVCEREAAAIAGLGTTKLAPKVDGLVLIGAGAIPIPALQALGGCAIRLAPLQGYPSSPGLERTLAWAEKQRADGNWGGDLARLTTAEPAWPFGTRALVAPIREFVRRFVDG